MFCKLHACLYLEEINRKSSSAFIHGMQVECIIANVVCQKNKWRKNLFPVVQYLLRLSEISVNFHYKY